MKINGIEIDETKLISKQDLIDFLNKTDASDHALMKIREQYQDLFGNELIWRYPISDGAHTGVIIAVVKEGFISLPYDSIDEKGYELFRMNDIAMFDEDSLEIFIDDWKMFSDDLLAALSDMKTIVQANQNGE